MQTIARIRPRELTGYRAFLASLIGAALTAACAQVAFHLPGNPVPITMQVFAVLCCGLMLGSRLGALAQLQYVVAGCLGAPVFAGFHAGPAAILGPTGGYVIGFIAAAFVVGLVADMATERTRATSCIAGLAGVLVVYVFGAGWLSVWLRVFDSSSVIWSSWVLGVAPFVGIDLVKVVLAAGLCTKRR